MSRPTQAFPLAAVSESTLAESRNLGPTSRTIQGTAQGGGRRRRPATEKRRMQIRTAQRKYREKQANRLRELELLVTQAANSAGQASGDQSASQFYSEISTAGNHDLRKPSEGYQTSRDDISLQNSTNDWIGSSLSLGSLESGLDTFASTEDIVPQISFNDIPEISFELPGVNITFSQTELDDILQTPSLIFSSTSESGINPIKLKSMSSDVTSEISEILHPSTGKDAYSPTQGAAYHDEPSPDSVSSIQLVRRIRTRLANDIIRWLHLDDTEEHKQLIRTAIERRRSARDIILAGLQTPEIRDTEEMEVSSSASPRLPDIQRNNLCLVRTLTLQAYLSNARAIGMSIDELYRDVCSSPFYRPQTNVKQDMGVVLKSFPDKIAHHLPITLAPMNPPLLDAKELKLDVIMNDGLTCWHVSEKISAQPKYWMLIGGKESEVWAQTQWWRGMRGETQVDLRWDSS
ncbi:hypothetical protein V2W45_1466110 [Cenococcum geophilum]